MNMSVKILVLIAFLNNFLSPANAQTRVYTVADAHSHNDYRNSIPFYRAYNKGFGSIEADVYAVNKKLMVAHNKKEIASERSLKILYIDPLVQKLRHDPSRKLRLLIEIKEDYQAVLPLVKKELKPLKKYFDYPGRTGQLSIVMTGAVPPANELVNYPAWMLFDVDHLDGFTANEWKRIGLVSFPFSKYTRWNGINTLSPEVMQRISAGIDSVHRSGKIIRFWATPDTEKSWLTLMHFGVDVIGTDKIDELGDFLNRQQTN